MVPPGRLLPTRRASCVLRRFLLRSSVLIAVDDEYCNPMRGRDLVMKKDYKHHTKRT